MTDLKKPLTRIIRGAGRGIHNLREDLVVTLYPGGSIGIRELRCKKEYPRFAATVLIDGMIAELEKAKRAKPRRRKARRGLLRR